MSVVLLCGLGVFADEYVEPAVVAFSNRFKLPLTVPLVNASKFDGSFDREIFVKFVLANLFVGTCVVDPTCYFRNLISFVQRPNYEDLFSIDNLDTPFQIEDRVYEINRDTTFILEENLKELREAVAASYNSFANYFLENGNATKAGEVNCTDFCDEKGNPLRKCSIKTECYFNFIKKLIGTETNSHLLEISADLPVS